MDNNPFEFHYDVFLSYRHKPLDNRICKKAHTLLETFKAPRRYHKAHVRRCFRDDEELPVAGVLSDTISEALKCARVLLVICSPDTPQSQWVDREVRTFIELGRSDRIYALLIKGDPQTSFPPSLKLVPGISSRTLEIESASEKKSIHKLKKELIKVIASATETPYEPLRLAIRHRHFLRRLLAGVVLSSLFLASGLYSLYQWSKASYYSLYAQREEFVVHDVINSVIYDLPEGIKLIPGASEGLIEVLTNNIQFLDRMMVLEDSKDKSLLDKGNNYLSLAHAYLIQGENENAAEATHKAIDIYEALNKKATVDKERLAIYYNLSGLYMQVLTQYDQAADYLEKAVTVYKELDLSEAESESDPRLSEADCLDQLAVCYFANGQYKEAGDVLIEEISLREKIECDPLTVDKKRLLAQLYGSAGSCFLSAKDYKGAAACNDQSAELYKDIYTEAPNAQNYKDYVSSLYSKGTSLVYDKNDKDAEYTLRLCLSEADKLVRSSLPEFEPTYFCMYAMYDMLYGDESKLTEALSASALAYEESPSDRFVRHIYAYALILNNRKDEAISLLKTLLEEKSATLDSIALDLEIFSIKGRDTADIDTLKEELEK